MVNLKLRDCSALQHLMVQSDSAAAPLRYGVRLSERRGLSLATVMVRKGKLPELKTALQDTFGLALPAPGRRTECKSLALAWSAPGQWLASAQEVDRAAFEQDLRRVLWPFASIANQSDGRTIIRISGPAARQTLAKGVPLDLHPSVFGPGHTASTTVAHITTHFWQIDGAPTYEFAVFRSFAAAFWQFLAESGAEYGCVIDRN